MGHQNNHFPLRAILACKSSDIVLGENDAGAEITIKARDLVVKVDPEALRFAAENHPDFEDLSFTVSDIDVFSRDVAKEINAEDEDGSTLLTRMLDDAIRKAVENGSEGVDYD